MQDISTHLSRVHYINGENRKFYLRQERKAQKDTPKLPQISNLNAPTSKECDDFPSSTPIYCNGCRHDRFWKDCLGNELS
jgi:hypothetical protein